MAGLTHGDWARIHAKAWSDNGFAKAFEADPRAAIREYGPGMGIDANAGFALMDRPDHVDDEMATKMAEGAMIIAPYCC